jgi:large subunit ribosomal protein L7/L12
MRFLFLLFTGLKSAMSVKTLEILEQIKSLKRLETANLVKQVEATFNVDASLRVVNLQPIQEELEPEVSVPTEFDVILESVLPDKKIVVLKLLRSLTGLGLKEAKEYVESTPKAIASALTLTAAKDLKQQLEEAGAVVSLQ